VGREDDPANQVAEDFPGLGDLSAQHRLPGSETLPDLHLKAADLGAARGHVQLEQEPLVALALDLPFLERCQQGKQVATARDCGREPGQLRVEAAHLHRDLLAAPLDRRGAAQLVDGELDRALDDFATQEIALDRCQHRVVRAVHRRFEPVDADGPSALVVKAAEIGELPSRAVVPGAGHETAAASRALGEASQQVLRLNRLHRPGTAVQLPVRAPEIAGTGFLEAAMRRGPERVIDDAQLGCLPTQPLALGASRVALETPHVPFPNPVPDEDAAVEVAIQNLANARRGPRARPAASSWRRRWGGLVVQRDRDPANAHAGGAQLEDPPDNRHLEGRGKKQREGGSAENGRSVNQALCGAYAPDKSKRLTTSAGWRYKSDREKVV
jgi:hypothetical protein